MCSTPMSRLDRSGKLSFGISCFSLIECTPCSALFRHLRSRGVLLGFSFLPSSRCDRGIHSCAPAALRLSLYGRAGLLPLENPFVQIYWEPSIGDYMPDPIRRCKRTSMQKNARRSRLPNAKSPCVDRFVSAAAFCCRPGRPNELRPAAHVETLDRHGESRVSWLPVALGPSEQQRKDTTVRWWSV
jgi:hypothetical protein